jgi:hypothetical protein
VFSETRDGNKRRQETGKTELLLSLLGALLYALLSYHTYDALLSLLGALGALLDHIAYS